MWGKNHLTQAFCICASEKKPALTCQVPRGAVPRPLAVHPQGIQQALTKDQGIEVRQRTSFTARSKPITLLQSQTQTESATWEGLSQGEGAHLPKATWL